MQPIHTCPGGHPYVTHNGPTKIAAVRVLPITLASECSFELVDATSIDTVSESTSTQSTAPQHLPTTKQGRVVGKETIPRKPFSGRYAANKGSVLERGLDIPFRRGVQVGYAENCKVVVYV